MSDHNSPFPAGIIAATVTPMGPDLQADTRLLAAHCRNLLEQGSNGIVLLGTTGEANSFSVEERKGILEGVLDTGLSPELLMVGTGCCAITDTVELTKHAVNHGIKDVLMLPPFYYKPVSDDALYNYYTRVIEAVGEHDLHIYLYHFPKNTGIDLSLNMISKLLERYPNTVAGIKDSGGDWHHMQMLMKEFPSFRLYSGTEEYLLETLKAGGAGCISATANLTIAAAVEVVHAIKHGTNADMNQSKLTALRKVFDGHSFVGTIKGFLAMQGGIQSWRNLRPPNEAPKEHIMLSIWNNYTQTLLKYSSIGSEEFFNSKTGIS